MGYQFYKLTNLRQQVVIADPNYIYNTSRLKGHPSLYKPGDVVYVYDELVREFKTICSRKKTILRSNKYYYLPKPDKIEAIIKESKMMSNRRRMEEEDILFELEEMCRIIRFCNSFNLQTFM